MADGEIFVQPVKSRAGAAPAAGDHTRCHLARHAPLAAVEEPVQKGTDLAGGTREIDRRPNDETVVFVQTRQHLVDAVVKDAGARLRAVAAGDAPGHGRRADPAELCADLVPAEGGRHLLQSGVRAAVLVGTAVDQ